jgi:maleate isomerase
MADARAGIRFDAGRHDRARLGFVLLAMEQTIDSDLFRYAPTGVGVHCTRAPMANEVTSENLRQMLGGLADAAGLLLPDAELDVICYACTSGSVVIGEEAVCAELERGAPGARATTLVSGVIAGLKALGADKIAVATPYLDEVNEIEARYLEESGFDVVNIEGLNIIRDADMVRVTPSYIREFARNVDRAEADALFISCGALRALEIIEPLEAEIGKPVVTSNQAMLWHCLRLAGIEDVIPGLGRLTMQP